MSDVAMVDVEPLSNSLHSIEENGKSENIPTSQEPTLDVPEVPDTKVEPPKENKTNLRSQKLPLPASIREHKPSPKHVVVLAFGSFSIRYGFASDSTPKKLFPAVAFPRREAIRSDPSAKPFCVPSKINRSDVDCEHAESNFDDVCDQIVSDLALGERRRGGGKPIPWKVEIEPILDQHWKDSTWLSDQSLWAFDNGDVVIGKNVLKLMRDAKRAEKYDIVFPIWDGKFNFECGAPISVIRRALDVLLDYIVKDLQHSRKDVAAKDDPSNSNKSDANSKTDSKASTPHEQFVQNNNRCATSFVTIVAPETSQRRDAAEMVDAAFRSSYFRCGAVFLHQSAVSCALGAGLATCAVVDIGHSATVVACVEDGIICGESRIHLTYGSHHIQKAFEHLLHKHCNFSKIVIDDYEHANENTRPVLEDESGWIVQKVCEQACGFNVDENDSMGVTLVKAPSGRSLRVKLGVGLRAVPAYGLIYPSLLKHVTEMQATKDSIPERGTFEKNSHDDNFVSDIFNDLRRSGIATSALPIGIFANDVGQVGEQTVNAKKASVVDAIVWSIVKAIEVKRPDSQTRTPDHYKRYLNAIVLAGGGARIDGIAQALEGRIKKGFQDAGINISDVTVIDGGKGKGDEELAAAAAVLKDVDGEGGLVDDTDTASLPWKGGAVMVEADALNDYWVYRNDWETRNVRALRERAPFYW